MNDDGEFYEECRDLVIEVFNRRELGRPRS